MHTHTYTYSSGRSVVRTNPTEFQRKCGQRPNVRAHREHKRTHSNCITVTLLAALLNAPNRRSIIISFISHFCIDCIDCPCCLRRRQAKLDPLTVDRNSSSGDQDARPTGPGRRARAGQSGRRRLIDPNIRFGPLIVSCSLNRCHCYPRYLSELVA